MDADAIVIGAGAAGLAAALDLARGSLRVVLLEARERIGGRVCSNVVTGTSESADLGAEFVHGPAKETMALLREAGITTAPTGDEGWFYQEGELRQEERDFTEAGGVFDAARSLPDDQTVDEFLRRFTEDTGRPADARAARAFVEGFDAADPAIASARAIAEELHSGVDATSARPLGGYRPMFELLEKKCLAAGVELRKPALARGISWRRGDVSVALDGPAAGGRALRARLAVVTLPVSLLRETAESGGAVRFDPPLSPEKRDALAHLQMGQVVKVVLAFRSPFWERLRDGRYRDAAFFRRDDSPFAAYWTQLPRRSRLVTAWAGGPKATALGGESEETLIDRAAAGFGALFGDEDLARSELAGGVVHDWDRDPFARGAYSYVTIDGGNARAIFGEPLEHTLFFAGEATSTNGQGGTVNGALESGQRCAREALAT